MSRPLSSPRATENIEPMHNGVRGHANGQIKEGRAATLHQCRDVVDPDLPTSHLGLNINPDVFLGLSSLRPVLEDFYTRFGRWEYVRRHITEQDWQRHSDKLAGIFRNSLAEHHGKISLGKAHRLVNGASGELLTETVMQLMSRTVNSHHPGSLSLLRAQRGELIDGRNAPRDFPLYNGYTLGFASDFNCKLYHGYNALTEFDLIAVARHAAGTTIWAIDPTTEWDVPEEKKWKHAVLDHALLPDQNRIIDAVNIVTPVNRMLPANYDGNASNLFLPLTSTILSLSMETWKRCLGCTEEMIACNLPFLQDCDH